MKGVKLSFLLPRCSLSYLKIVQTEGNAKFAKIRIANLKPIYFIFITEVQPILFKDSAVYPPCLLFGKLELYLYI